VQGETKLFKTSSNVWELWWAWDNESGGSGLTDTIFISADTVVRLTANFKITTEYDGTNASVNDGDYPRLEAQSGPYGNQGKYKDSSESTVKSSSEDTGSAGFKNSVQFDSNCIGDWQEKVLTIPAQPRDYFLTYGLIMRDNDLTNERSFMKPIEVEISKPHPFTAVRESFDSISRVKVRDYNSGTDSFVVSKKRISGRI